MVIVTIKGVDYSPFLTPGTLNISDEINAISTCDFQLNVPQNVNLEVGYEVLLLDKSNHRYYGGTIDRALDVDIMGSNRKNIEVSCVDFTQLANRFHIPAVYVEEKAGNMVKNIVAKKLAVEGVTTNNVMEGPIIEKAVFNYLKCDTAFNEIAEIIGYNWYIDYYKDLHFFDRESYVAPFEITADNYNYTNLQVEKNRDQYRNKQIITGGKDTTDPQTITFNGDGSQRVFTVPLPLAQKPTLILNGVDVSDQIGIKEVDDDKRFYWSKNTKDIVQDNNDTSLTENDELVINYIGYFPAITIAVKENEELNKRREIEGGSGIYEHMLVDASLNERTLSEDKAKGLLRKYGDIPKTIQFQTDVPGLRAGHLIHIDLPEYDLNDKFLIKSVSASDVDGNFLRYDITALDGEDVGGWENFFRTMAENGQKFIINEDEVVTVVRFLTDEVICKDDFTIEVNAPENRIGIARIGFSETL
jgi:hypothetical protein